MSRMFEKSLFPLLVLMVGTLFSCQRKAEEPVVSPGAGRGQVWFEVSERPMGGETKAAPATKETFTTSYESFGVVGYAYESGSSSKDKVRDTMQVSYVNERNRWEPATPVKYSLAGDSLEFYAWYPYNTTTVPVDAPSEIDDTIDDTSKHPTIAYTVPSDVADQKDLMVAKASDVTDSPTGDGRVSLTFGHMLTAVKFSIGVGTTCSRIKLSGIPGTGTLDMSTGVWRDVNDTVSYIIDPPAFGSWDSNAQCPIADSLTLMLIPQTLPADAKLTAETSAGNFTASLAGQVWEPGKEVTYKLTDLAASFSVSATKKVRFSPGNLQYTKSNDTWSFMAHQYSTVEYTGQNVGGNYGSQDVVSLFGWGTSGHKFASGYGSAYQPWSTNGTDQNYGPANDDYGLTGEYADGDWGSAVASTLGSGWRTLTKDEWTYLLFTRTGYRFCKATVNDVSGLVIFPDGYIHPSGADAPKSRNTYNVAYTSNTWAGDAWTKMESAGCVFLPAAGQRQSTSVSNVGSYGYYWSSTQSISGTAYDLKINSGSLYCGQSRRCYGQSVRLVQDL